MWVYKKTKIWVLLSFLAPGAILYSVFLIYQIADAFHLSLFHWSSITTKNYAGFANYTWLIKDAGFWRALGLTAKYMLATTIGSLVIGFTFGYLVYLGVRGHNFFRVVILLQ